jgi:ankyrin repeat protein
LAYACSLGDAAEARRLLRLGQIDPNEAFDTPEYGAGSPLLEALRHGYAECVNVLLRDSRTFPDRHPDIAPEQASAFNTPILCAAAFSNLDCAALLAPKADIRARDASGRHALILAAARGDASLCRRFVQHIAPDEPCANGGRAIHHAASAGQTSTLLELAPLCDLQALDLKGRNAFMAAAGKARHRCMRLLCENIDPRALDYSGMSALDILAAAEASDWELLSDDIAASRELLCELGFPRI